MELTIVFQFVIIFNYEVFFFFVEDDEYMFLYSYVFGSDDFVGKIESNKLLVLELIVS